MPKIPIYLIVLQEAIFAKIHFQYIVSFIMKTILLVCSQIAEQLQTTATSSLMLISSEYW